MGVLHCLFIQDILPLILILMIWKVAGCMMYLFLLHQSEIKMTSLLPSCQLWIVVLVRGIVTWWALAAKPRPSCLHTTMASLMPQFSLQTVPQRLRPPTSISTSTRPSDGTLPPASRTWEFIRLKGLNGWFAISESEKVSCFSFSFHTVFSMPVLGTLQRTEASWLCLNVHGVTSWK